MKQLDEILEEKEDYLQRYIFANRRIHSIFEETTQEDCPVNIHGAPVGEYFHQVSAFLLQIEELWNKKTSGELEHYSMEKLQALNTSLYHDITGKQYEESWANPSTAQKKLNNDFAPALCTLYTELRGMIVYAYENRPFFLAALAELFIEIYNILEQGDASAQEIKSAIYYYFLDYSEITVADSLHDSFDPNRKFAVDIICNCDLSDLRYLYRFGEYITENELETAKYLNTLSEQEIHDMAFTFTDGYRRGFSLYNIDLSKKKSVNIRYHLGFERMIREVIRQFEELGLSPCIYRASVSLARRSPRGKVGYYGASPNKQYDYDHRMDDALFFDKAYAEHRLQEQEKALESMKELCAEFAGPAVMETFGEVPFNPIEKEEALHYSKKQQKWKIEFQAANGMLLNEYIPGDQTSFSIISYPLPEIGENYREIFEKTICVNTLDQSKYLEIQTKLIDALDQGEFVTITGRNGNHTKLTVSLTPLTNPEEETKFENCLADVNIPLGEVFTSPRLNGTNGLLHVTKTFLNDLEYHDIELTFEDGIIKDYNCRNFDTPEENKKYIRDNILFQHETLPMGEFAIGTNTTAYALGKKYQISHLLPILITEKTGPHFAVGDTCFSHEEELLTRNPDGKKMIAKENDFSMLRHTDSKKAYFNCHTDITIPYDELGDICVHTKTGQSIPLIQNGRFVLPGTEALNEALETSI